MKFLARVAAFGLCLFSASLLLTFGCTPAEAKVTVKLATLAPDNSAWHKILKEMGQEWQESTNGNVHLRIYAGGVAGDDTDMVRKMRVGQLHAGALTSAGLASIDESFNVFSVPLFFDSYEEFVYVREQLTPVLEEKLAAKGFKFICWGDAGWVYMMTVKPFQTIDELQNLKIWTWAGNDRMVQVWKSNGYTPVALSSTDVLVGLQTGLIDGLPTTPYACVAMQYFRHTQYMFDLGLGPLNGAIIMSLKRWKKIPEEQRTVLLEAANRAEDRIRTEIPKRDREAVDEMVARGTEIVEVGGEDNLQSWRAEAERFAEKMKGKMFPEDILALALQHREAYRRKESSQR